MSCGSAVYGSVPHTSCSCPFCGSPASRGAMPSPRKRKRVSMPLRPGGRTAATTPNSQTAAATAAAEDTSRGAAERTVLEEADPGEARGEATVDPDPCERESVACAAGEHCVMGGRCELDRGTFPHRCKVCGQYCHAICGESVPGEEGSGSLLTCFRCRPHEAIQPNSAMDRSAPCVSAVRRAREADDASSDEGSSGDGDSSIGGVDEGDPRADERTNSSRKYSRYDARMSLLLLQECHARDVFHVGRGNLGATWKSVARELNKAAAASGGAPWRVRGARGAARGHVLTSLDHVVSLAGGEHRPARALRGGASISLSTTSAAGRGRPCGARERRRSLARWRVCFQRLSIRVAGPRNRSRRVTPARLAVAN